MPCETIIDEPRWIALNLEALSDRAFEGVMAHLSLPTDVFEVTVLGCDDARIASLNADFRGKPEPTNVLSWPSADRAPDGPGEKPAVPATDGDKELGDIAIAFQTCAREACAQRKKARDHVTHLLVHGMLHLLGYDHIRDEDAALMEKTETKILGKMGISNPY